MTSRHSTPAAAARWVDDRVAVAGPLRRHLNRVVPDEWSRLLVQVALFSFVVLVLTGTYLTFFFDPSMAPAAYHGRYAPMRGVDMSQAYRSTLAISFDVRGGLLIRQMHYWAAHLFLAALLLHLLRMFFTGTFRRPRELNWILALGLLVVGAAESYSGHLLPDDLLSGTGLRVMEASIRSIPVLGTWLSFLLFGGPFPGDVVIGRLYVAHVLLLPAVLIALLVADRWLDVRVAGPASGRRAMPAPTARTGGLFFLVLGVLAALGGLAQINPVWLYGPFDPAQVSSGSGPDWYLAIVDGASRLFPSWELRAWGHDIPPVFWATVVLPGVLVALAVAYPFVEARHTGDRTAHHTGQRPRDVPVRTGLGAMALAFVGVLFVAGGGDTVSRVLNVSLDAVIVGGRIALVLLPPLAYVAAYRLCLGLQRHDREVAEHGVETGLVQMRPSGEFVEVRRPFGARGISVGSSESPTGGGAG